MPQQARTRGQLVVYRTDSEQESLLLLLLPWKFAYHYYYYRGRSAYQTYYYYRGRSAYHYHYYLRYQDNLHLQSQKPREVSFQELIILYKENPLPQPHLRYIIVIESNIIVLEPQNL